MSLLAAAASGRYAATVQLLKLFDAAVLIAVVHIPRRDREAPYAAGGNAGNLHVQRYVDEVLEPVVTLRNKPRQRFVFIGTRRVRTALT